jgi:predicted PhzF superfamily epimerase YddE/YHI9
MGRPSRIQVDVPTAAGEIEAVRVSGSVRIWAKGTLEGAENQSSMLEP